MIDAVQIRLASLNEIIALRADVLIGGTDRGSAAFDGDDATDTKHFGAFIGSTNVACASCMRSDREDAPAWQLRGMATHADHQSLGIGAQLLAFIEAEYATLAALLWCNARTGAVAFYERAGWRCTSEVFEIAGVGPHREMEKLLGRH